MKLADKKIGFAITGSFCTLKHALIMLENLKNTKCDIIPIISENVATLDTRFFQASDFVARVVEITGKQPITTIPAAEPIGPQKLLDMLIIAPCTGNSLAKINYGITDTAVTMSAKAHLRNGKPLLIAISTNDGLSNNAKNIGHLMNAKNIFFVPFRQDDPIKKCTSLVADFSLLLPAAEAALEGKQLQPVLIN